MKHLGRPRGRWKGSSNVDVKDKVRGTIVDETLSALTRFVVDGNGLAGSVTRELFGEVYRAVSGDDGRCMQLAQGRV